MGDPEVPWNRVGDLPCSDDPGGSFSPGPRIGWPSILEMGVGGGRPSNLPICVMLEEGTKGRLWQGKGLLLSDPPQGGASQCRGPVLPLPP